jgi:hypothetical protein
VERRVRDEHVASKWPVLIYWRFQKILSSLISTTGYNNRNLKMVNTASHTTI